jgi:mitogen-activated protein kinase organizer 1
VQTLDSTIRLLDAQNGKLLNTFKGHVNDAYRSRACFGHAEASVVTGDEQGSVWQWDLVDVRPILSSDFITATTPSQSIGHAARS